ncbi:hypothetical protein D3C79_953870 [compost metagenome]
MDTAAAGDHDRFFTRHQAFCAFRGVTEGLPGAGHQIEVDLQLSGDIEVVHRGTDDDGVVRFQFSNQLIGKRQRFFLVLRQWVIAGVKTANHFAIQFGQSWVGQITKGKGVIRMRFAPLFNKKID